MKDIRKQIEVIYLDWCNNFVTIDKFADYYGLSILEANIIIELGRIINNS